MDVADLVRQHYGGVDLQAGILAGLDRRRRRRRPPHGRRPERGRPAARGLLRRHPVSARPSGPRAGHPAARRGLWHRRARAAGRRRARLPGDRGGSLARLRRHGPVVDGAGRADRSGGLPGRQRRGPRCRRRVLRRGDDGARRDEHPRQGRRVHRRPAGTARRWDLRGVRADAGRRRRPALSPAVGRGQPVVVRRQPGRVRPRPRVGRVLRRPRPRTERPRPPVRPDRPVHRTGRRG